MNKLWNEIHNMLIASQKNIMIFDKNLDFGEEALEKLQITSKSALGAVLLNTSGVVIDNWIRILGHEGVEHSGILSINVFENGDIPQRIENMLIVANDIVGGVFAINASMFDEGIGKVWYFALDTLEWENMIWNILNF